MSENKEKVISVDNVISALTGAINQQALTPVLEAATVLVITGQRDTLVTKRSELQAAEAAEADLNTHRFLNVVDLSATLGKQYIIHL